MSMITRVAAIAAGFSVLALAGAAASAPPWGGDYDPVPDGSYQQSCREISAFNGQLYARCANSGGGAFFESQLLYRSCTGDIANIEGRLQCEGGGWSSGSGPVGLVLYENADYRGQKVEISDSVPDLSGSGIDGLTTSVRILRGVWELCSAKDFGGDCVKVHVDVSHLKVLNLNDRVSSVRRVSR